jgi:hypothetical protein
MDLPAAGTIRLYGTSRLAYIRVTRSYTSPVQSSIRGSANKLGIPLRRRAAAGVLRSLRTQGMGQHVEYETEGQRNSLRGLNS